MALFGRAQIMGGRQTLSPSVWVPPIAGYYMLCDVSNAATLTLTADGGNFRVDQIADTGSGGKHLEDNGSADARPIYGVGTTLGSRLGCVFDGTDDELRTTSSAIDGDQTIFIVCDITSTDVRILLEHSANWNTNNGQLCNPNNSGEMSYGIRRSSTNSARFATTTTTGLHCWTFRADGTHANQTIRKDGTGLSTTSFGASYNSDVGTGTVTANLHLGARSGSSLPIAMTFGLILIYNTTLSDGDCGTIEASLKSWWGTP